MTGKTILELEMIKKTFKNFCLWFSILAVAGCGATQFASGIPESFAIGPGQKIELPPIENATGKALSFAADQVFNLHMSKLLRERNLESVPPHHTATVILKTKLIEFEQGDAFQRWLLPGLGTTVCTVHAELLDRKTGALIGAIESRQTVSFGGAYSIGAYEYICRRVAEELIQEIDKKLGKKESSG